MPATDPFGIAGTIRSTWTITPERDQQIGGLLMWVPMCFIYLGAIFAQIVRWFGEPAVSRPIT
jgi:cytochrome c oxidase assembly factor CtaG